MWLCLATTVTNRTHVCGGRCYYIFKMKCEEGEAHSLSGLEAPHFLWNSKDLLTYLEEYFLAAEITAFSIECNYNSELQDE